jgi:Holliday junction resolvase RusA-like endonuclease
MIEMLVPGVAATKGSWVVMPSGHLRADNKKEKAWAAAVGWAAKAAMLAAGARTPFAGPVRVEIEVSFPRPRTTKFAVPPRRDVDKLARSVLDALTGIVYLDDGQVSELRVSKAWCKQGGEEGACAHITVEDIAEEETR